MATPTYPLADLLAPSGEPIVYGGHTVYAVTDPAQAHDRVPAVLLELILDRCLNTFGVAPCVATGTQCYNTHATCKDKANFRRGSYAYRFTRRGQQAPAGLNWRPYIERVDIAPTEIRPGEGLAVRSQTQIVLADETDRDTEGDPYLTARGTTPGGTFWGRLQARNPNAVNRLARLRRGWWGTPFDFAWATDELYLIEAIRGPSRDGTVSVVLSDVIRLLDRAQLPAATDGKLAAALPLEMFTGTIESATATTAVLAAGASPEDSAYVGHELHITGNVGTGQRRRITAYSGATRTATVDTWSVVPDASSAFAVRPLFLTVQTGRGEQYGDDGYARIGDEVIRYTARSGDSISWPDATYRGQFGTDPAQHNLGAGVQKCHVWQDATAADVVLDLLAAGGVDAARVDVAELIGEDETWLRGAVHLTRCVPDPTRVSELLRDLSTDLGLMLWWDPKAAQVRSRMNLPTLDSATTTITDSELIAGSVQVERRDADRLTQVALYYDLRNATDSGREGKHFGRGEVRVDADAQSGQEYGDVRPDVRYSRWLAADDEIHAQSWTSRRLNYLRDAPHEIRAAVDPRTMVEIGELIDLTTRALVDETGTARTVRARVTKVTEHPDRIEFTAQTTPFAGKRWAWIAPAGQPDYDAASEAQRRYAYIAPASGTFADATDAYRII